MDLDYILPFAAIPENGREIDSLNDKSELAHRIMLRKPAVILVAPDVDALCAAHMLADLFKQDDVMHHIVPVSGIAELENVRDDLLTYSELHTLILLNIGSVLDLPADQWFGEFPIHLSVHVIDSLRPQNLSSLFAVGENGERIIYEPELNSGSDSDESDEGEDEDEGEDYEDGTGSPTAKRRPLDDTSVRKRRKLGGEPRPQRMSRDQREVYCARIAKHYTSGTSYGQSASGTIYILATVLERVDNDLLWLTILGLTYQYTTFRISRAAYDKFHSIYYDEVFRLNPHLSLPPNPLNPANPNHTNPTAVINPDDQSVRATEELRFMLFRHWTLYEATYHSSYVAGKLGWKERGRKRLTGLLAKMGFSIPQTQQPYTHVDIDLKSTLCSKLEAIAPEYGLLELSYTSFTRRFGYRSPPLSAADAVEAVSALLDVAGGVRMEIEGRRREGEAEGEREEGEKEEKMEVEWWKKNFWTAFDALSDIKSLHEALSLSMSLHRAIIHQGTSIIDKQDIRTMRSHHVVILSQGPDLALFSHPGVLSRLALWLVEALRDRLPGTAGRKSLPFVAACLNEREETYIVVGVMAALDFGDVRKKLVDMFDGLAGLVVPV
ncbi:hypothetical protein PILCRDRAFT_771721 [Piloderma croceum F 1598]|uniref:CDC45-like protein n=1 Tax=Piloderma croceum (strain F 1598) TaxID=765440 RepID=A0A0C3FU26_PILCF|nr:hypothetical protein PILCRDRAFT_771721 [Piloderma croceum F 1598]